MLLQALDGWHDESSGLTTSCPGHGDDVEALHNCGDGLSLDGGGLVVSSSSDGSDDLGTEVVVAETSATSCFLDLTWLDLGDSLFSLALPQLVE